MTQDTPAAPLPPRGAGALLHTEVERVPLGTHGGRRLTARVEHRTLRIALGRRWHASLSLGRRRPVAVEVAPGDDALDPYSTAPGGGRQYDEVAVPTPPAPWPRYARRVAAVALGCWLLVTAAGRIRARGRSGGRTGEAS